MRAMTRAKGRRQQAMNDAKVTAALEVQPTPTYAERSITDGRDDEHIIYEMFVISQYEDGSVLNCATKQAYSAEEVANSYKPQKSVRSAYLLDGLLGYPNVTKGDPDY